MASSFRSASIRRRSCGRRTASRSDAFPAFNDVGLDVTFSAEADRVIAGDWTGEIRVWNAADAAPVGTLAANPPTIQMRIDQASAAAAEAKQKQDAAAGVLASADGAMKIAAAALEKMKSDIAAAEAAKKAAEEKAKPLAEQVAKLQADQAKAIETAQKLEAAAGSLKTAIEQVTAASKLDGEPADLKIAAAGLESSLAARTAQIAANKAAAEIAGQQLAPMVKELEVAQAAATQATQTVASLTQQLPTLEQTAKAAQEQLAAAQKTMGDAQAAFTSAEANVKRWQDELAFAHKPDTAQAAVTQ